MYIAGHVHSQVLLVLHFGFVPGVKRDGVYALSRLT